MSSLEEGSVIAGKYRLERVLSRGGMGAVWRARHLGLDIDVAVKLMAPELASSAEGRARFEREAKASAYVKSPHVVHVHDYGLEGETPYIVMELLEGEDLDARLNREGRLTPAATLGVVSQVCKALQILHGLGLVHRDLKPANIFITRQGGDELIKILDFGIAKATGPILAGHATKTGTLLGSPYYMSPEQVRRSKDVDWRSDLWSLGVIVFRCVTGRLPWSGEELGDLFIEICTDPIPVPSQIAPDLKPAIDQFVGRALTREMDKRFQSADELARALAAAVEAGDKKPEGATIGLASTAVAGPARASSPASPLVNDGAGAPHPAESTLGPSANTIGPVPSRPRSAWIALAVAGGALALGATALLRFAAPTPEIAAPPPPMPAAAGEIAPAPMTPGSSVATEPPPSAASASASPQPSAVPAANPSASVAPPPNTKPSPNRAPVRGPKSRKDDPRDHM